MHAFSPIGFVEAVLSGDSENGKDDSSGKCIALYPTLTEGLNGLEPGQRLVVVFFMHLSRGFELLQHPRGDKNRAKRGVFALRSPHRPNPIGITTVDLVAINGNVLTVRGLDALIGTPVLDLKPVIATQSTKAGVS